MKTINRTLFSKVFAANKTNYGVMFKHSSTDIAANKNISETAYDQQFTINTNSEGFCLEDGDEGVRLLKALIASVSAYLSRNKISKEDEATAFIMQDVSGNFKFAGIVEFHPNTDSDDEPGSWSYALTFNGDDITSLEKTKKVKKLVFDEPFKTIYDKIVYDIASLQFPYESIMYNSINLIIDTLTQVLDAEAIENQTVDIEIPGYLVASVAVEDGEKVYAMTPDGAMKMIIKDDSKLSNL